MKLKSVSLHWQILIGLILGVLLAVVSRIFQFESFVIEDVALLGDVFIRALKMIIVPLIVSSIISGVTNLSDAEHFGRLSLKTISYYVMTSILAILTGLILVNLIAPGIGANLSFQEMPEGLETSVQSFSDLLIRIIPENPLAAMARGEILPTIFFSLLFGFFITRAPEPYKTQLTGFFQAVFEVMMGLTHFIILFAPVGVFALIAKVIAQTGFDAVLPLFKYMVTVILGLLIHATVTLPLLVYFLGGISPLKHFKAMSAALMTAFSTSSSSATLPLTMDSIENNAGVSNKVSSFVLPLGATINMDGTALYECVAAMFIAQVYGIELSFGQQMIVVMTALLASIGAAGIPMAGLVMITIILKAVGLPLEGIGMILAVDRILDMLRTSVNVWSDSCGAVLIARSEGEDKLRVLKSGRA
ncbi:sodium:dicarboxylate symporter [Caldithrix abyssi DSM 13497]|uniref:Na+/H+-dicarboxylate symporter n=1 Tax=Caldithrix abyssi DSM 13497 TaxID=880073 RepID=H1XVR0_CALAY|nr:dicarboxylate/amino acid:cation symporter [Caldithrix abyssi]APF20903.1 Na+/H+-dicarboxylate symporter [Caldithrix abyssi DSM 13497]EHO40637.1 sodium:dicarboxylate symporter [Caldithrix abyssi DSM 13497]